MNAFEMTEEGGGRPDRRFMVAAVMIRGVSDSAEDARCLAEFLRPFFVEEKIGLAVNLIPYNKVNDGLLKGSLGSSSSDMEGFRREINAVLPGMAVHIRETRGAEASCACGQLATKSAWQGSIGT